MFSSSSEVVTRLLLAPNRSKFFHHPLNIIDVASVIPIYVTLTFDLTVGAESDLGDLGRLIQVHHSCLLYNNLTKQTEEPLTVFLFGSGPSWHLSFISSRSFLVLVLSPEHVLKTPFLNPLMQLLSIG